MFRCRAEWADYGLMLDSILCLKAWWDWKAHLTDLGHKIDNISIQTFWIHKNQSKLDTRRLFSIESKSIENNRLVATYFK